MWSASSMTVISTSESRAGPARSGLRAGPGWRSRCPRHDADSAPDVAAARHRRSRVVNSRRLRASGSSVRLICIASSRVGASTSPRGARPNLAPLLPRGPLGAILAQPLDQRRTEGERLAGSGATAAEHVAAGQHGGDGRGLDGERGHRTHAVDRGDQFRGQTEVGEGQIGDVGRRRRLGDQALVDDRLIAEASALVGEAAPSRDDSSGGRRGRCVAGALVPEFWCRGGRPLTAEVRAVVAAALIARTVGVVAVGLAVVVDSSGARPGSNGPGGRGSPGRSSRAGSGSVVPREVRTGRSFQDDVRSARSRAIVTRRRSSL